MSDKFRRDFISYLAGGFGGAGIIAMYFAEPLGFVCVFISVLVVFFNIAD